MRATFCLRSTSIQNHWLKVSCSQPLLFSGNVWYGNVLWCRPTDAIQLIISILMKHCAQFSKNHLDNSTVGSVEKFPEDTAQTSKLKNSHPRADIHFKEETKGESVPFTNMISSLLFDSLLCDKKQFQSSKESLIRIEKLPLLTIRKARTRFKTISKSKKDFYLRTEELGTRKTLRGRT